jgi:hypothetical protein
MQPHLAPYKQQGMTMALIGRVKREAALRLHDAVLKYVQPHRKTVDTFPTFYRLNCRKDFERYFNQCSVSVMSDSWEPAYFFGRVWLYRLFSVLHKFMPKMFGTASIFILQKSEKS